nr:N-acetylmuramoyl-L-alanine amidase [uncultured Schaedlerella sp.]
MPKLFVIAGHGAGDPGACGNGYTEAERVRVLARKIKELGGGNVILGDLSRDYYRDNGVSTLNLPEEYQIVELHMDAGVSTARGGHVIIFGGFQADDYDKALANMLAEILPGRSQMIVGRNNLANPERAAMRGYGYRLVEFGFITNAEDVKIFNTRMDDIAAGVLAAFGIKAAENKTEENKAGGEDMGCILSVEGTKTQYYFDGKSIHAFTNGKEKSMIKKVCRGIIDSIKLTEDEFKDLKNVLNRS